MAGGRALCWCVLYTAFAAAVGQELFLAVPVEPPVPRFGLPCTTPDCEQPGPGIFAEGLLSPLDLDATCQFPRDPKSCPQDLDDCPRFYNNTKADFDVSPPLPLVLEPNVLAFLGGKLQEYLDLVDGCVPPTAVTADGPDVFNGAGGRALMHLRLHRQGFKPAGSKPYQSHLQRAREYIDAALRGASTIPSEYCGFMWGSIGVYALAAVIYDLQGDAVGSQKYVAEVIDAFHRAPDDATCKWDDFDGGRGGMLLGATLLDNHFGKTVVDRSLVINVANAVIRRGVELGTAAGVDHMLFISPNDNKSWVGVSHGSAGVLYGLLLNAPEILEDEATRKHIVSTLEYIVSTQLPSGNFPSEYYAPTDDVLVQWDHGAPGVSVALLAAAGELPAELGAQQWVASARRALDVVWERGLSTKGLMLCHGIGGNIYMQLAAAKLTNDMRYLHRALQFIRFVAETPELHDVAQMRIPTPSPWIFWAGSWESAVIWTADFLVHAGSPLNATMPIFEMSL